MKTPVSLFPAKSAGKPIIEEPVNIVNGAFEVKASVLAPLLGVAAADLPRLIRERQVTTAVERGEGDHAGTYRLTFFHRRCRARLVVDGSGFIRQRSAIDFGDRQSAETVTS